MATVTLATTSRDRIARVGSFDDASSPAATQQTSDNWATAGHIDPRLQCRQLSPWPPRIHCLPPTTPAYTNNRPIRCPDPRFHARVPDGCLRLSTSPEQPLDTIPATAQMRRYQSLSSVRPSRHFWMATGWGLRHIYKRDMRHMSVARPSDHGKTVNRPGIPRLMIDHQAVRHREWSVLAAFLQLPDSRAKDLHFRTARARIPKLKTAQTTSLLPRHDRAVFGSMRRVATRDRPHLSRLP